MAPDVGIGSFDHTSGFGQEVSAQAVMPEESGPIPMRRLTFQVESFAQRDPV